MDAAEWMDEIERLDQSFALIANEGALWLGISEWLDEYKGEIEDEA